MCISKHTNLYQKLPLNGPIDFFQTWWERRQVRKLSCRLRSDGQRPEVFDFWHKTTEVETVKVTRVKEVLCPIKICACHGHQGTKSPDTR